MADTTAAFGAYLREYIERCIAEGATLLPDDARAMCLIAL